MCIYNYAICLLQTEVVIPEEYATVSTANVNTVSNGLKIEAMHDRVGVRVITRSQTEEASFIAIPDESLTSAFNALDVLDGTSAGTPAQYRLTGLGV